MSDGALGIPWLIGGVACLVVAVIYALVWPRAQYATATSNWNRLVLRWFHGLVWLLLAISFFVRGTMPSNSQTIAGVLAFAALISYGTFMFTLIRARRKPR